MKWPDAVSAVAQRLYASRASRWLNDLAAGLVPGGDEWPVEVVLGTPSEAAALPKLAQVEDWVGAWKGWAGPAEIVWVERRWRALGAQRLPERALVRSADGLAVLSGMSKPWTLAQARQAEMLARWPKLAGHLGGFYDDLLTGYLDADFQRMLGVLAWVSENPAAECYPRELPVPGIDSKWLETTSRQRILTALLRVLQKGTASMPAGLDANAEFHHRCGIKSLPRLVRLRVLDRELRARVGGLTDISAPLKDLGQIDLPAREVLVVENLQTGLALPDMAGTVAFMRLGYGVDALGAVPWVVAADRQKYWGDLDTHGFSILARARSHLPRLESVLMDETTLLAHQELWGREPQPCRHELAGLTEAEQAVYDGLRTDRWGEAVRLEQERVGWSWALRSLGVTSPLNGLGAC